MLLGTLLVAFAIIWIFKILFDEIHVFNQLAGIKLFMAAVLVPWSVLYLSARARKCMIGPFILLLLSTACVYFDVMGSKVLK